MNEAECLFCNYQNPKKHNLVGENDLAYARWDNSPLSEGHAEIVPKRHIDSFFDLTEDELTAVYDLAKKTKDEIMAKHKPDAFNIGVNDGEAAGRTIHHLHIHIIPRYRGDAENQRGGVRRVIPGKGDH